LSVGEAVIRGAGALAQQAATAVLCEAFGGSETALLNSSLFSRLGLHLLALLLYFWASLLTFSIRRE
jgi:hypothetical protein